MRSRFVYTHENTYKCRLCPYEYPLSSVNPERAAMIKEHLEANHECFAERTAAPRTRVLSGIDPRAVERRLIALGF